MDIAERRRYDAGMIATVLLPMATVVLVHSPFLGPTSLRPLADELAVRGHPTLLPDLRGTVVDAPVHKRLIGAFEAAVRQLDPAGSWVLVGHSGAGPLLPALADAAGNAVAALVYLDAGLPTPAGSWRDAAPAELSDELLSRARGARLPGWHRWFDPDPLAELVPDPKLRAAIADEEPEVAVAFLTEPRPSIDWPGPSGYLQLSPAYAAVADEARALGWPVRRLDCHHLAAATDPNRVANALTFMIEGRLVRSQPD